jgi:hypothetical protein
MPISIDPTKSAKPSNEALSKLSQLKKRQDSKHEKDLNNFLRLAIPYVAANYPGNTIERSREAAMLWIRVFKLGLIRGDVLWTFGADEKLNSLFLVRPVNIESFKPLDAFDVDDNGKLMLVDVGIITDQSARIPILKMLHEHRPNCTHVSWIRHGDASSMMVAERNKFNRLGLISSKTNFKNNITKI